jgi:ribosomal protein S18 acetylase RimI-like enzyme
MSTDLEGQTVVVRRLRPADLEAVVLLDAKNTGRMRRAYFQVKLAQNLAETGIQVSLAAERNGAFVGFLLARVYYGEFGLLEPVAVLDTFGVHPDFRGRGVGRALLRQLRTNLRGLGIPRLRTDVGWDDQDLLGFFHHEGFRPAPILCLELDLTGIPREEE